MWVLVLGKVDDRDVSLARNFVPGDESTSGQCRQVGVYVDAWLVGKDGPTNPLRAVLKASITIRQRPEADEQKSAEWIAFGKLLVREE